MSVYRVCAPGREAKFYSARAARAATLIARGLPAWVIAERTGLSEDAVLQIARRSGLRITRRQDWWGEER